MRLVIDNMHDPDAAPLADEAGTGERLTDERRLSDLWNQHCGHTANRGWRARLLDGDGEALLTIDGEDDEDHDAATLAGAEAAENGEPRESCPHPEGDELREYWLDGYDNG